jgi:hypothetical protein
VKFVAEVIRVALLHLFEALKPERLALIPELIQRCRGSSMALWSVYKGNCKALYSPVMSWAFLRMEYLQYRQEQAAPKPSQKRGQIVEDRARPGAEWGLTSEQVGHMSRFPERYQGHPALPEILEWKAAKKRK